MFVPIAEFGFEGSILALLCGIGINCCTSSRFVLVPISTPPFLLELEIVAPF
jgi:hypothetical protein